LAVSLLLCCISFASDVGLAESVLRTLLEWGVSPPSEVVRRFVVTATSAPTSFSSSPGSSSAPLSASPVGAEPAPLPVSTRPAARNDLKTLYDALHARRIIDALNETKRGRGQRTTGGGEASVIGAATATTAAGSGMEKTVADVFGFASDRPAPSPSASTGAAVPVAARNGPADLYGEDDEDDATDRADGSGVAGTEQAVEAPIYSAPLADEHLTILRRLLRQRRV
jgi:hypothetical protein